MFAANPTGLTASRPAELTKVALFRLQGRAFALAVEKIDHILQGTQVYPLPMMGKGFSGVIVHDDDVVPFFDLWRYLSLCRDRQRCDSPFTVMYISEFGNIGLPADEVVRIVDSSAGAFEQVEDEEKKVADRYFLFSGEHYALVNEMMLLADLTG